MHEVRVGEGSGQARLVDAGCAAHAGIEEFGLDRPTASHAPVSGGHFFVEAKLGFADRRETGFNNPP